MPSHDSSYIMNTGTITDEALYMDDFLDLPSSYLTGFSLTGNSSLSSGLSGLFSVGISKPSSESFSTLQDGLGPLDSLYGLRCVEDELRSQKPDGAFPPITEDLRSLHTSLPKASSIVYSHDRTANSNDGTIDPRVFTEAVSDPSAYFDTLPSFHPHPHTTDFQPLSPAVSVSTGSSLSSPDTLSSLSSPHQSESSFSDDTDYQPVSSIRTSAKSVAKSKRVRARPRSKTSLPTPYPTPGYQSRLKGEQGPRMEQVPLEEVKRAIKSVQKSGDTQCPFCSYRRASGRVPDLTRHITAHNHAAVKRAFKCLGEQEQDTNGQFTGRWVAGCGQEFCRRDALLRHLRSSRNSCKGDLDTIIAFLAQEKNMSA